MQQRVSWEANRSSASQEIPRIWWNQKVHYRINKSPPLVFILDQIDPVRAPSSHFLNIHFNIVLPFMPGSFEWSSSLRFSHQNRRPHSSYMPYPCQSSWFDHPNDIWWGVQSIKFLVMQSSPLLCYLVPLRPSYPPQHLILENLHSSLNVNDQVSHPYKTTGKFMVMYILIFTFFIANWKTKDSAQNDSSIPKLKFALNFLMSGILIR
jgi:hypothetical protein